MTPETLFNPNTRGIAYDTAGHTAYPSSWVAADTDDPRTHVVVASGLLVVVATPDPVPDGINPAAAAAFTQTLANRQPPASTDESGS